MTVIFIYASTSDGRIGTSDGQLPWNVPKDLELFKKHTLGHSIVMGRKTWESIGSRKLPNRVNIVMSRAAIKGVPDFVFPSIERLRAHISADKTYFIIGGATLFREALSSDLVIEKLLVSRIEANASNDNGVFFLNSSPFILSSWIQYSKFTLLTYIPSPAKHFEIEYINLVKEILSSGHEQSDRTGTGTQSIFGHQMKFNLREAFPLLTTKKMAWKSIQEELFFFLAGKTNTNELKEKGVNIWHAHTSAEFLKVRALDYEEGQMGPMYGAQWRNYGGAGIDQLLNIINELKKNPFSRRLVMSTLNMSAVDKGVLWPCHGLVLQFYCRSSDEGTLLLSAVMYQRSADVFLGLPFNIASYALLVHLIANHVGMTPDILTIQIGNAHIYNNHVDQLREQISRPPLLAPRLEIIEPVTDWNKITRDQIRLRGYFYHPPIRGPVAI
jgi:thymidylate synthase